MAYYYHWFVEHAEEARLYFLKEFPGIAIQDVICQAMEHANKLSKHEFALLAPVRILHARDVMPQPVQAV